MVFYTTQYLTWGSWTWLYLDSSSEHNYTKEWGKILDNDMQYPELHKKHRNVDGYIIMDELPKGEAVNAAWINTKLKGRKQFKKVYTFVMTSLTLINPSV